MAKRNERTVFSKTVLKAQPGLIQVAPGCNRLISWKLAGAKLEVFCTGIQSSTGGCNFCLVPLGGEIPAGFGYSSVVGTYRGKPALLTSDCIGNAF